MAVADLAIVVAVWAVLAFFLGIRAWPVARRRNLAPAAGHAEADVSGLGDHLEPAA